MTRADDQTLHLPFHIPAKEWFNICEVAQICGMSERFIEKLYDQGTKIAGHTHNGGTGARMTKRIPRVWIVAYLVSTATYDDPALVDAFVAAGLRLSPAARLQVADRLRRSAHA